MDFTLGVTDAAVQGASGALFVILLVAALAGGAKAVRASLNADRRKASYKDLPFKARHYLLTKAERSLYEVLLRVAEPEYRLFAKVRLADLVTVEKGMPNWQGHFNRVKSKHVDFVICDMQELRVVAVVELDDRSHKAQRRRERDAFVDRVLTEVGLPVFRVAASDGYAPARIREMLAGVMGMPVVELAEAC
jgi:hypothetical protein